MSHAQLQDEQKQTSTSMELKERTNQSGCSKEPRRVKVSFGEVVEEKMLREKKGKEPKLKTVTKKIQRLLLKPFDYDANLS